MVNILSITPSSIELEGVQFSDVERVEKIMEICHKYKHLYKDGYPYGRKTRKERGLRLKKWTECPGICFTYLVTNDSKDHHFVIVVLVSDEEALLEKYTKEEILYFKQMYTQSVAEEILETV